MCVPKKCNEGNYVVANEIFTDVCDTSLLFWTLYSHSVHFFFMTIFLYLTCSITPFLRDRLKICSLNYLAILMSLFTVEALITICVSYAASPDSFNIDIYMDRNRLHIHLIIYFCAGVIF